MNSIIKLLIIPWFSLIGFESAAQQISNILSISYLGDGPLYHTNYRVNNILSHDWNDSIRFIPFFNNSAIYKKNICIDHNTITFLFMVKSVNDKKYIICDTDRDSNFIDEIVYKFDWKYSKNNQIDYPDASILKLHIKGNNYVHFKIEPFKFINNDVDSLALSLNYFEHRKFSVNIDNDEYDLFVAPKGNSLTYSSKVKIILSKESVPVRPPSKGGLVFDIGDTINLGLNFIVVKSIERFGKEMIIEIIKNNKRREGRFVGNKLPFNELTLRNGEKYNFITNTTFKLLDCWGTWCKPCLDQIPLLKAIHHNYPKVEIISISYFDEVKKLNDMINTKSMDWYHAVDQYNKQPLDRLKVESFPRFYLLDKDNNIIFVGNNLNDKKLLEILNKLE